MADFKYVLFHREVIVQDEPQVPNFVRKSRVKLCTSFSGVGFFKLGVICEELMVDSMTGYNV